MRRARRPSSLLRAPPRALARRPPTPASSRGSPRGARSRSAPSSPLVHPDAKRLVPSGAGGIIGVSSYAFKLSRPFVGQALHLVHVRAFDADELGRAFPARRVQVALVVDVGHARLERVDAAT